MRPLSASCFSGFCYSEFAARIPKSGSAYNYTYQSIGEFAAYIIGWNLVLELVIGTASEAKAIANQIDSLMGNAYEKAATRWLPIRSSFLSTYPDFIAPVFVTLITGLLSLGSRESTKVNNILTFVNLSTVGVIVFSGLFRINPANWSIKKSDIPAGANGGAGGFVPFGVSGIITGAAKCFFGFVGFDGIATTGEETRNPKRNIPLAIILSLLIVFVCYFSIAVVITMVLPYYEQNAEAPFPAIFDRLGWPVMKWAVTIGSLVALFTAMFGAFFPLPRILYSMSRDGLLYKPFSYISPKTQTPLISTAVSGVITAIMSAIFKLDQLVDMMSIGTLLAYIIVAISVLLLRYSDDDPQDATGKQLVVPEKDLRVEKLDIKSRNATDIDFQYGDEKTFDSPSNGTLRLESIPDVLSGTSLGHIELEKDKSSPQLKKSKQEFHPTESFLNPVATDPNINIIEPGEEGTFQKAIPFKRFLRDLFNTRNERSVTRSSQKVSMYCIYIIIGLTICMSFLLNDATREMDIVPTTTAPAHNDFIGSSLNKTDYSSDSHKPSHPTMVEFIHSHFKQSGPTLYLRESADWSPETCRKVKNLIYTVFGLAYFATFTVLSRQGQNTARLNFKVPFVPLVPCVCIFMNVYLMINLDISTWIRFFVWLMLGLIIYFSYSIFHSKQKVL